MASSVYGFRPMTADDLPLIVQWLKRPHVMQWWGDTHEHARFALTKRRVPGGVMW